MSYLRIAPMVAADCPVQPQAPERTSAFSTGLDIRACFHGNPVKVVTHAAESNGEPGVVEVVKERDVSIGGTLHLFPGERALIPTGWQVTTDPALVIKLYPRSGTSFKQGLGLNNSVGVIDRDYPDELFVSIINNSWVMQTIEHNDRIAQVTVEPDLRTEVVEYERGALSHPVSERIGGIGSSGIK